MRRQRHPDQPGSWDTCQGPACGHISPLRLLPGLRTRTNHIVGSLLRPGWSFLYGHVLVFSAGFAPIRDASGGLAKLTGLPYRPANSISRAVPVLRPTVDEQPDRQCGWRPRLRKNGWDSLQEHRFGLLINAAVCSIALLAAASGQDRYVPGLGHGNDGSRSGQ